VKTVQDYYQKRFPKEELKRKDELWKVLCTNYFEIYVKPNHTVMDIGAGYCEFINNINANQKFAVDINPDTKKIANKNVNVVDTISTNIPTKFNGKMDIVFMSNFLEHLSSKEEIIKTLERCYELLKKDGKVLIMQPNIDLVHEAYWDFIDHKMPLNEASVLEALELTNFKIDISVKRFLPYTTKSSFANLSNLIGIYLLIPPKIRPFAGQSFFVAHK